MFVSEISEFDKSIKSSCLIGNSISEVLFPRKILLQNIGHNLFATHFIYRFSFVSLLTVIIIFSCFCRN